MSSRLEKCIKIVEEHIRTAEPLDIMGEKLLSLARDYLEDALYYKETDAEISLEAVSYASGLIDAGVLLGLIRIKDHHFSED